MTVFAPLRLVPPPEPPAEHAFPEVRVRFRQPVSGSGFIGAAWWPCTGNLAEELPDLLEVLWIAGRDIRRMTYNLRTWGQLPRRINIGDHAVRLGGIRTSDPLMIRLRDSAGLKRIDMLVIPPSAESVAARRALQLAGESDSPDRAEPIRAKAAHLPYPSPATQL